MELSWMRPGVGGSSPCPGFVGAAPTAAAGLTSVRSCACYNSLLQPQPDHLLYSIGRRRLGGPIPATTVASARTRVFQSAAPSSVGGDGPSVQLDANTTAAAPKKDDDGAERMFATARALHLRRHRSPASRALALELLRETMRRRSEWKETDSRFAVESGIDLVFKGFSCPSDISASPTGNGTPTVVGDKDDVCCLRETLARIGYTARSVQERFGVAGGQRLPGPYYLRKNFDHRNADILTSMGRPKDALDVAIRLFLLGLALPLSQAERSLGSDFLESADRLGMLGECPVDPLLLVSLVQLFPLDAEALLPAPPPPGGDQHQDGFRGIRVDHGTGTRGNSGDGGKLDGGVSAEGVSLDGHNSGRDEAPPRTGGGSQQEPEVDGDTAAKVVPGGRSKDRENERERAATAAAASHQTRGVVAASDLIFATDWPPPGSTAMTEEPVMYIGPDSIGLVQHAPWARLAEPLSPRDATGGARDEETILDLCCGSGIQGIASAVLRRGAASVTCVDINPRAVRFSRFNALLNGLDGRRFRAVVGDLYGALDTAAAAAVVERDGSDCAVGDHSVDDGGISPATSSATSYYDLILANPPFVPVPPRLGAVRRRYDVFASGGPDGEEVIEGIFRGALERLRPDGGVLAVVTELANPRTFDTKLRRWVGTGAGEGGATLPENNRESDLVGGAGSESASAVAVATETGQRVAGEQQREEGGEEKDKECSVRRRGAGVSPGLLSGGADAGRSRVSDDGHRANGGVAEPEGTQDISRGFRFGNGNGGNTGGASSAWSAVVLHERQPWTARQYAARRAGSPREAEGWERHLGGVGIEEMSAGFVFVRHNQGGTACPPPEVPKEALCTEAVGRDSWGVGAKPRAVGTAAEKNPFSAGTAVDGPTGRFGEGAANQSRVGAPPGGGSIGGDDDGAVADDAAEIEVHGVEKLWAPHNRAAVVNTSATLRRMNGATK